MTLVLNAGSLFKSVSRVFLKPSRTFILGIESSCDDSAAAVLSECGKLLGETVISQNSVQLGGVVPSLAMGMHAKNLPKAIDQAMEQAKMSFKDIKFIAVTHRPGLSGSLVIGTKYAKYLSLKHQIPIIPIHHMEAHALTARMISPIKFPFLVLLISGGHSLLAMAQDVHKFVLLGKSRDNSPGEVLDKVARFLNLYNVRPDLRDVSGGRAIEIVASEGGNPSAINFPLPLKDERDCDFSFGGLKTSMITYLKRSFEFPIPGDQTHPHVADVAASFQFAIARHLCQRLQRGLIFCEMEELWGDQETADPDWRKTLVVSGGVASNQAIKGYVKKVCDYYDCDLVLPPPRLCTDNGVMIAWNGLEKVRKGIDILAPDEAIDISVAGRAPLGEDITDLVRSRHIKCKWAKLI